jgi:hypothetical protein
MCRNAFFAQFKGILFLTLTEIVYAKLDTRSTTKHANKYVEMELSTKTSAMMETMSVGMDVPLHVKYKMVFSAPKILIELPFASLRKTYVSMPQKLLKITVILLFLPSKLLGILFHLAFLLMLLKKTKL